MTGNQEWTASSAAGVPPRPATPPRIGQRPTLPPSTLVLGACGGAGVTTTVLGMTNAAAAAGASSILAIEATPAGGDLAERGADANLSKNGLEHLILTAQGGAVRDDVFVESCSDTTAGARLLHRAGDQMSTQVEYGMIDGYLRSRSADRVYDIGHRLRAPYLAPILNDAKAPVILVVPCRADAFNRMRSALETIANTLGPTGLARTVVAVSNQDSNGWQVDVAALRNYLGDQVWGVEEIPYDQHLGMGTVISYGSLAPDTVSAYERLVGSAFAAVADIRSR